MTARQHIVFVAPGFPTHREEPGLAAIVDLVERIARIHDVTVVALRHPPQTQRYDLAGAKIVPLAGRSRAGAIGRAGLLSQAVRTVVGIHRRRPIDLLHCLWADEPGAVGTLAARLLRRPSVVSILGGELVAFSDIGYGAALGRGGRWTTALALRLADRVTVGSTYVDEQLKTIHGGKAAVFAPLGIDVSSFAPADRRRADTVLFVGSLEPVKDPTLAIGTFASVARARTDLRLIVCGEGSLRGELEQMAQQSGLAARIELRRQVPRAAMPELYRSASVLLVTSRHEGQSLAAVEAAASGVPIVGTRVGVLVDLGSGALTVNPGDQAGLAEALGRVLDDHALGDSMGEEARRAALARFDIELTSAATLAMYDELIKAPLPQRHA